MRCVSHHLLVFVWAVLMLSCTVVCAEQRAMPTVANKHIKMLVYDPNDVHEYVGCYDYTTHLVFEDGEEVINITMGNSTGWSLVVNGNRLFIKPTMTANEDGDADASRMTNVVIMTNMNRVYHFEFHAIEATSPDDDNISYEIRIVYPRSGVDSNGSGGGDPAEWSEVPDPTESDQYNLDYVMFGASALHPSLVFDDGRFTYMKFDRDIVDMPVVFGVDSSGYEFLINRRVVGDFLIVELVGSLFTLRHGEDHACVANRAVPYDFRRVQARRRVGLLD